MIITDISTPKTIKLNMNDKNYSVTALYISAPTLELLNQAKEGCIKYLPFSYKLPCGNVFSMSSVEELNNLHFKDVLCPCGNKNHWFVRCVIDPSLGKRTEDVA